MSARSSRPKPEKFEMGNPEYVKWRKIWIAVDVVGFSLSVLGIAMFRLMEDKTIGVVTILCAIAVLAVGVVIDHQKVTRVKNQYRPFTGYSPDDKSKEAVAARKAEKERIARLVEADKAAVAELEAKKAAGHK